MKQDAEQIKFRLNGNAIAYAGNPVDRLSTVLRHELGNTATKTGCDAGDCGACSVLLDDDLVCACLVAVGQVSGREVTTLEGLNSDEITRKLQSSFAALGAAQCGICTPAMLVTATSLLKNNPQPCEHEVESALGGVLCRCTGYRKIIEAVTTALDRPPPAAVATGAGSVGQPIKKLDASEKLDGSQLFGADGIPEDALWAKVIRSPHDHARFDISGLEKFVAETPGLHLSLDATDIPGKNCFGVIPPFADQPVFAEHTARFRGEAVAMLVGERHALSALDPQQLLVEWHPLPALCTMNEALGDDAPLVHQTRAGNVMVEGFVRRGDPKAALKSSAFTVKKTITTGFVEHAYIEPEAGYATIKDGRIEIFATTQAPHMDREAIAEIMAMPESDIRIVPTACGGGFGSKLDISLQPFLALAALRMQRPVAMVYTRPESMAATTKRHPSNMTVEVGCDQNGRLTGFEFEGNFNTGAYASWGPTVANRVPVHASGPYAISDYRALARGIHTHLTPSGAFRGFGVPQAAIAQETVFDELADKAGIDRLEFRLANVLTNGAPTVTGQVFDSGVGMTACLESLKPHWKTARGNADTLNRKQDGHTRYGVGLGTCWYGCGNTALPNPSTIKIGVKPDGTIWLHQGAVDIGQGSNTVIAQIVAETLKIDVKKLNLIGADTDITPDAGKTSASRQTYVSGLAAHKAALALVETLNQHSNKNLSELPVDAQGYVLSATETFDPPSKPLDENGQGNPYPVFGYGAQLVELAVDTRLGTVKLLNIVAAHDVGRAINPVLVEGQIEGGIAQGIGLALMEEYIAGRTNNLHDYLIPTFGDVPPVTSIIIEEPDPTGPFGAKGLGEHVLIPTAPAILNAIRDATGASVTNLPATPDKIVKAIEKHRSENDRV